MLSTYLDGTLYDNPIGLNELSERIYFNAELSMYLNKLEGDVSFVGDGYNYLRAAFNGNTCSLIEVLITDSNGLSYDGVIFANDIKWNLSKREAECKIVSDKYIQSIDNNKGIKVQLGVALAKDLESIQSTTTTVTLPDVTGTTDVSRVGFRVFDVFSELVSFMTNDELTFVSDYFDPSNGGEASYDVIMTGEEVRLGANDTTPLLSYTDFFNDMNKLHNLAGVIEGDNFRIEPKEYFRQSGTSTTIENINDVQQESNREQFYASIKMGSSKVADGFAYLIRLSYNGFQKEQFFLSGNCNLDNELDLQLQTLVTDTNIIQDIQPVSQGGTNNSDYDDDIVIIHCKVGDIAVVTISPLSTDYFYNEYYTNRYVSERWASTYPFSILQLLETENPLLRATLTADQTFSTSPNQNNFSPDNDSVLPNFDSGNDYQIGSILVTPIFSENIGYFEAPSDMVVTFSVDFHITGAYWKTTIWHVDSSGEVQTPSTLIDINPFVSISNQYSFFNYRNVVGGTTLYMPSGTRMYVRVDISSDGVVHSGGVLEAIQTGAYGGVYKVINENDAFISRTSFKYPSNVESWASIKAEPFKRVNGTFNGGLLSGYPIDITRNITTGAADFKLYQRKGEVNG